MVNTRLVISVACMLLLAGCGNLVVPPSNQESNLPDFERTWTIADSIYPFFQFKHINWDSVHALYEPLAREAKGDQIYEVIFQMLAGLKDGHVGLYTTGGDYILTYRPPRQLRDRLTFDPLVVRNYFPGELKLAGGNRMDYGITRDSIGYVRISTFRVGDWIDDFDYILNYVRNTKGLIIDVRGNDGGSDYQADYVISRLLSSPLPTPPAYFMGKRETGPPIQPAGAIRYLKPVVVLMNGTCFSATEDFLNIVKQVPTVTLVGDTSAGASGAPEVFLLPSGRRVRISTLNICRYDGTPIEWNGIIPDVLVLQTEADIKSGRDPQLERALAILK